MRSGWLFAYNFRPGAKLEMRQDDDTRRCTNQQRIRHRKDL